MTTKELIKRARRFTKPFRVDDGRRFRLRDIDPGDTLQLGSADKPRAKEALATGIEALAELQDRLYAQDRWALLLVFQAMDAAGKDGTIKHVMSGINPQGCQVNSFKGPSPEDLDHNYLWRCMRALPERGRIGIFNRSYYEEVLVVKVHPELVVAQNIPNARVNKSFWEHRYEDINNVEKHLTRNGTLILKFFLHLSKDEQRKRLLERLNDPKKHWKSSPDDIAERAYWKEYRKAYEEMLEATSTKYSTWHVIPADHKWVTRAMVATIIVKSIAALDLKYPE